MVSLAAITGNKTDNPKVGDMYLYDKKQQVTVLITKSKINM